MTIRIITSAKFSTQMSDAFKAGLADAGRSGDVINTAEIDGAYDDGDGVTGTHQELYDAMTSADGTANVDLIIAAGGLLAAHAANKKIQNKPFLVLFGESPRFVLDNDLYCGGVNLDMVSQTIARHDFIVSRYSIAADRVCLIWNSNSKIGRFERKAWKRNHNWPAEEVATNSEAAITTAFTNAKAKGDAVVVGGDPYFTAHMNAVVAAANDSATKQLKVCYPFGMYKNATPSPKPKVSMIYGSDLEYAYRMVGRKAGAVLDNLSTKPDTGLSLCPPIGPIYIGG
jgi:hypothetical protein